MDDRPAAGGRQLIPLRCLTDRVVKPDEREVDVCFPVPSERGVSHLSGRTDAKGSRLAVVLPNRVLPTLVDLTSHLLLGNTTQQLHTKQIRCPSLHTTRLPAPPSITPTT